MKAIVLSVMEYVLDFIFKQTKNSAGSKNFHYWEGEWFYVAFYLGKTSHMTTKRIPRRGHNDDVNDVNDDDCLVARKHSNCKSGRFCRFRNYGKLSYFFFNHHHQNRHHHLSHWSTQLLALCDNDDGIFVHAPVTLCAEKLQKIVCGTQAREKSTPETFNEIEVKKNV